MNTMTSYTDIIKALAKERAEEDAKEVAEITRGASTLMQKKKAVLLPLARVLREAAGALDGWASAVAPEKESALYVNPLMKCNCFVRGAQCLDAFKIRAHVCGNEVVGASIERYLLRRIGNWVGFDFLSEGKREVYAAADEVDTLIPVLLGLLADMTRPHDAAATMNPNPEA